MSLLPLTKERLYTKLRAALSGVVGLPDEGVSGDEALWMVSAAFTRLYNRVRTDLREGRILLATLPAYASGTVTIEWDAETVEDYTISAGSRFVRVPFDEGVQVEFILDPAGDGLLREASESAGEATYAVRARWIGLDHNVGVEIPRGFVEPDLMTYAGGTTDEGRAEWEAGIAAGTIRVKSWTATTGGKAGFLHMHARDSGVPVQDGETEVQVRRRLRAAPGGVTETNIVAAVVAMLGTDDVQTYMGWRDGFVFGESAFGDDAFMAWRWYGLIVVPPGSPVDAVQALVDRLAAFGFNIEVVEGD